MLDATHEQLDLGCVVVSCRLGGRLVVLRVRHSCKWFVMLRDDGRQDVGRIMNGRLVDGSEGHEDVV